MYGLPCFQCTLGRPPGGVTVLRLLWNTNTSLGYSMGCLSYSVQCVMLHPCTVCHGVQTKLCYETFCLSGIVLCDGASLFFFGDKISHRGVYRRFFYERERERGSASSRREAIFSKKRRLVSYKIRFILSAEKSLMLEKRYL